MLDRSEVTLQYAGDSASFTLQLQVPVTRAEQKIEIFANDSTTPLLRRTHIVAGDVFVINGQSNALADITALPPDRDLFVRGYNSPFNGNYPSFPNWTTIDRAYAGVWGARMARIVSEREDVPIALFNFAEGGQRVSFFEPGASGGNYARVLDDLDKAGVAGQVRAFFWSQGEQDGYDDITLERYKTRLSTLFGRYRQAFGTRNFYLHQTRPRVCSTLEPIIPEAQRRLAQQLGYVTLVGTTNLILDEDRCHYKPEAGYGVQGERLAELVLKREYGVAASGVETPLIDSARITGSREITVFMSVPGSNLTATGNPWPGFFAEGVDAAAVSGAASGKRITLQFDRSITAATGLTFQSHVTTSNSYVHNDRGVGIVTWYDVSLIPGDGAASRPSDLELSLSAAEDELVVGTILDVTLEVANTGGTTVTDAMVRLPLPQGLAYGSAGVSTSGGVLLDNSLRWTIPRLQPGQRETLTASYRVQDLREDVVVHAQVLRTDQRDDPDSTPGNRSDFSVEEDDEARLVLNNRRLDCQLRAAFLGGSCGQEPDSLQVWTLAFDADDVSNSADITLAVDPADAVRWSSSSTGQVSVSYDTLATRGFIPITVTLSKATAEYGCLASFPDLHAPEECVATPIDTSVVPPKCDTISLDSAMCFVRRCDGIDSMFCMVDTSSSTISTQDVAVNFSLGPNPVSSGGTLRIEFARLPSTRTSFEIVDMAGRRQYSGHISARSLFVDTHRLKAGIYLFRVAGQARRFVVL